MSQISTTPQLNPTVIENNPTQVLMEQPAGVVADYFPTGEPVMKGHNAIHVQNMDFKKVATMEKFLKRVDWTIDSTADWFKYEFTIGNLDNLITDMASSFQWRDFGTVHFRLITTLNAFVAGLTVLYYDPSPDEKYWVKLYGITPNAQTKVLFPNVKFEPTKSQAVTWTLPFSNPFRMYPKSTDSVDPNINIMHQWIRDYPMGRITAFPLVPLITGTTGITRCPFALRAKMEGLRVAGTDYAN